MVELDYQDYLDREVEISKLQEEQDEFRVKFLQQQIDKIKKNYTSAKITLHENECEDYVVCANIDKEQYESLQEEITLFELKMAKKFPYHLVHTTVIEDIKLK